MLHKIKNPILFQGNLRKKNYFEGSYKNAVSFLVEKNEISVEDLEFLLNELKNKD